MYRFFRITIAFFLLLTSAQMAVGQNAAALEAQAQQSTDRRESMTLYYQSAEKYMSSNPAKASIVAHQAYLTAIDLNDNVMAARAAYLNAEGYARQSKYSEAKVRYNRGKESSLTVKDFDFAAKCLDKMASMARSEGNDKEASTFTQQAKDLRNRKKDVVSASTNGSNPSTLSNPVSNQNRPVAPTNQAELNQLREQYRRQVEQFEGDKQRLSGDIALLQNEKAQLSAGMTQLRQKEQQLNDSRGRE